MSDMGTLELFRNDLLQTAATRRGTLVVFPSGANKQQKIGIGDLGGVVQCFSVKKQECKISFKSLPSHQHMTATALGRGSSQRDRMFIAEGPVIRGLTKKGKEFYRFDTNMTESISGMLVLDRTLVVLGEYMCITFEDNREKGFYMSPDRINAFDGVMLDEQFCVALACQDRSVRIVHDSSVLCQTAVEGVATCVLHVPDSHDVFCKYPDAKELLYGTENGILGQLFLNTSGLESGFKLENVDVHGGITVVYSGIDFTKDGMNDIAVGRDDGFVEIYSMDETSQLCKKFETQLPDRINTLSGGFITNPHTRELIVQTYTGKVIAYSTQRTGLFGGSSDGKRAKASTGTRFQEIERLEFLETKIEETKSQIASLATQIKEKKDLMHLVPNASLDVSVDIKQSCRLDSSQNCFVLMIEVEKPIFCIALCCDVEIELLPAVNGVAILSISPPDCLQGFPVLATFRCQECANRLDIRFKAQEGKPGTLTCFILPKLNSRLAFSTQHRILPLCLHERVHEAVQGSCSDLTIGGDFTHEELCLWFAAALPDFPRQWTYDEQLVFQNSLSGNVICIGKQGDDIQIHSQDICALDILREALITESAKRNQKLNIKLQPDVQCLKSSLELLWKDVESYRTIDEKESLASALTEIQQQEDDVHFLDQKLKSILDDAMSITEIHKEKKQRMDYAAGSIYSFLTHYRRLVGVNKPILDHSDLSNLLRDRETSLEDLLAML